MALSAKSMFLYGYQVTPFNSSIDFRAVALGPVLQATLSVGYYSLAALMTEWSRAMQAADPDHVYTITADRTIAGGTQNRVNITTDSAYLDLLFATGPRTTSTAAPLLGFNTTDRTGSISYFGNFSSGTSFVTTLPGYNYLSPDFHHKYPGVRNVSASGIKEAITFGKQQFIHVEFKYEPGAKVVSDWLPFMDWATQQRLFEFIPEVSAPTVSYDVTLDATDADGNGMAYQFKELLPQFPNLYQTGKLTMRLNAT